MNPLAGLKDIHLPPEPGLWPLAPGWWVVIILLAAGLALSLWWAIRCYRSGRYRREALAHLREMERGPVNLGQLIGLVRRTGLSAPVESPWPTLPAAVLFERLDEFNDHRISNALSTGREDGGELYRALSDRLYRQDDNLAGAERGVIIDAVRRWIRHHRREDLC